MRRWIPIIAAFLVGAILASAGWAWYSFKRQTELAIIHVTTRHGEATLGEQVLTYLDSPDPLIARRLSFAASNMVAGFSGDMDFWDREFPYIHAKMRYAAECERFDQFMRERQTRASTIVAPGVQTP
jgi:hypothetical protein